MDHHPNAPADDGEPLPDDEAPHDPADSEMADRVGEQQTRADRFLAASRAHAAAGQGREAVLAMCAADIDALQQLLRESGLEDAPDLVEQLGAVGDAVLGSLAGLGSRLGAGASAREAVESFRDGLVATFDPSVHDVLRARLLPAEHLETVVPHALPVEAHPDLAGRTPEALLADLRATAADCAAVAEVMVAEGDTTGALRQMWQSDLAAYEAHLVASALRSGDPTLSTVTLRWGLARGLMLTPAMDEGGLEASVTAWRSALAGTVGHVEVAALDASFQPVPLT